MPNVFANPGHVEGNSLKINSDPFFGHGTKEVGLGSGRGCGVWLGVWVKHGTGAAPGNPALLLPRCLTPGKAFPSLGLSFLICGSISPSQP